FGERFEYRAAHAEVLCQRRPREGRPGIPRSLWIRARTAPRLLRRLEQAPHGTYRGRARSFAREQFPYVPETLPVRKVSYARLLKPDRGAVHKHQSDTRGGDLDSVTGAKVRGVPVDCT